MIIGDGRRRRRRRRRRERVEEVGGGLRERRGRADVEVGYHGYQ